MIIVRTKPHLKWSTTANRPQHLQNNFIDIKLKLDVVVTDDDV